MNATKPLMANQAADTFRYDINALRAWAVLVVVLYHFNAVGFASGFVGVDIFFVISGYLVGGQALAALAAGEFSLRQFWTARLRRIAPALMVLIVCSLAVGWALSMPDVYLKHVRQMLFASSFLSNITFANSQGYFDAAAHTKPLLHTWSLSVEWQFYFFLPAILLVVWRVVGTVNTLLKAVVVLLGFMFASMAWCFWLAAHDTPSTFFWLTARIWELLAGVVAAGLHQLANVKGAANKRTLPRLILSLGVPVAAAGWLVVLASPLVGLSFERWPGLWTLLPVVGAAAVVGSKPLPGMARAIQHPLVQRVGDWSYSIYLWHWPVWVFFQQWASYRGYEITPSNKLTAAVLSVCLAYVSYRWVEQPVRLKRVLKSPTTLWYSYGAALVVLTLFTAAAVKMHGFPSRVPDYQQRVEAGRRINTPRDECFRNNLSQKRDPHQFCTFGAAPSAQVPKAILWGDSIANQYLEPLTQAAAQAGIQGLIATQSGCRALLVKTAGTHGLPAPCERFNQEVLASIEKKDGPQIVLLGQNWGGKEAADEAFLLVDRLLVAGKTVVLILPLIRPGFDVPDEWLRAQFKARGPVDTLTIKATPSVMYQDTLDAISQAAAALPKGARFLTVNLAPQICEQGLCYLIKDGVANFRDTHHISSPTASKYNDLFTQALRSAMDFSIDTQPRQSKPNK